MSLWVQEVQLVLLIWVAHVKTLISQGDSFLPDATLELGVHWTAFLALESLWERFEILEWAKDPKDKRRTKHYHSNDNLSVL